MSLLLLFRPLEDATPPAAATPLRTLLGVGLTLAVITTPALVALTI